MLSNAHWDTAHSGTEYIAFQSTLPLPKIHPRHSTKLVRKSPLYTARFEMTGKNFVEVADVKTLKSKGEGGVRLTRAGEGPCVSGIEGSENLPKRRGWFSLKRFVCSLHNVISTDPGSCAVDT